MADKKYYWLKLKTGFFGSKEMKKLRKIAGGDTYTIIYLKLQLLSLQDEGYLYFDGVEDTFAEELALVLDEDSENVQTTLFFLEKRGLLSVISDSEILLTEVPCLIGSESSSAERVRRFREKQTEKALQCNATVTDCNSNCNIDVTLCNAEIEIEKDKEIELEKRDRVSYQQIADMYNDICISFPKVRSLSEDRKKAIKARLKTYSVEDFEKLFRKAEASTFLKGANNRNWSATFDWLIKDSNIAKVLDGNYDNKNSKPKSEPKQQNPVWDELDVMFPD
jgi:predicted phage replisome organizer